MSIILESLAMPAIADAIENNLIEEMACFGRALPQGELHKTPELLSFYTGAEGPNGVLYSRFAREDVRYVMASVDATLEYFGMRGVTFGWTVGPSTRPANVAAILESRGFVYSTSTTGMAIDIPTMREDIQLNVELSITEIKDLE